MARGRSSVGQERAFPTRVLIITLLSVLLLALFVIAVVLLASGIRELMEYLSPDPESH